MRIVVPVPGIRRFDRADVVAGGGRAKGLGSDGAGAVVGGGGVNWCGVMLVAVTLGCNCNARGLGPAGVET